MGHEHETMLAQMEGFEVIGFLDIVLKQLEDEKKD